jgi:superfamily II DNA or RNA helicase
LERVATLQTLVGPVLYQQAISAATGRTLANYQVRRVAVEMTKGELRRYRELGEIISRYVAEQRRLDPRFQWPDVYKQVAATDTAPEQAKEASRALRASRIKKRLEERNAAKLEILSELFRSHAGESILVFVGSNVMAREIALQFMVPCLLSHCGKRERADLLEGFAGGRYPVLVANQVLDEGIDLPAVKVAIVLGGMGSSRQAVQRLGRLLRRNARDANRRAVLYEVVTSASGEVERSRKRRRHEAFRTKQDVASGPAADKPTRGEGGPDVA